MDEKTARALFEQEVSRKFGGILEHVNARQITGQTLAGHFLEQGRSLGIGNKMSEQIYTKLLKSKNLWVLSCLGDPDRQDAPTFFITGEVHEATLEVRLDFHPLS